MSIREWRGRMGRTVIVDAVSEVCRSRSVTHVLMSEGTFKAYHQAIQPNHVRSGIKRSSCHGVGVLIVDGLTDEAIFAFNHRRAKVAGQLLRLIREEKYDDAIDLLDGIFARGAKWIHVASTPKLAQEGDDDEAAGQRPGDI